MAASQSRRLRRVIKEYVKKLEQKNPGTLKQLNEFFIGDQTIDNPPGWTPTPWPIGRPSIREKVLRDTMHAGPVHNGLNPHSYQLDVVVTKPETGNEASGQIKPSAVKDRLWFYEDGDVWSTNMPGKGLYYKTVNKKILIYTDDDARDTGNAEYLAGEIKWMGTNAQFFVHSTEPKIKPLSTSEKMLDRVQTVMDWLGFIPGIGDVVDMVNATLYFIRGKNLEGFLSLIAVIPFFGSAIKAIFKVAIDALAATWKGFKYGLRLAMDPVTQTRAVKELWSRLIDTGKFSKANLIEIGNGLQAVKKIFGKHKGDLRALPYGDELADQLDNFGGFLDDSVKQIDELSSLSKVAADRAAASGKTINRTITAATDVAQVAATKIISYVPAVKADGLFKRMRGLAFFPEKKLMALAKGMEMRFVKNMAHPSKLMTLLRTSKNPERLIHTMRSNIRGFDDVLSRHFPEIFQTSARTGQRQMIPLSSLDDFIHRGVLNGNPVNGSMSRRLDRMFREVSQDPGMWERVSRDVAEHAMKNDSFVWNLYKTDALKSLATSLDPRYMKNFFDTGFRKSVDWIYNELHDMGEDISKDTIADNPTGVVYPILKSGLNQVLPGDTVANIQKYRDIAVQSPVGKMALSAAGYQVTDDGAIEKSKNLDYTPYEEAGGSYQ